MKMTRPLTAGLAACLFMAGPALAQTCNDHIQGVAPDSRYTNHGNGTVTDNATGLMWKKCSEGLSGSGCASGSLQSFTWQGALQHGQAHTFAGYSDWRLPNVNELSSLVEERCYSPAINATLFPNTSFNWLWSSSPDASSSGNAWFVSFGNGLVVNGYRYGNHSVRLVRGGQ